MDINEKDAKRLMKNTAYIGDANDCWEWQGARTVAGYGLISIKNKNVYTHRVSFALHNGGTEPEVVMHVCDNPPCINPAHLRAGTKKMNAEDMIAKGRSTAKEFCHRGHNDWTISKHHDRISRRCRTCTNERNRKYRNKDVILDGSV